SGHPQPPGGDLNEHVWYDIGSAARVADAVAAKLSSLAPSHAGVFTARAAAFTRQVGRLAVMERRVRRAHAGEGVGITEPLPLYMLRAMGLRNLTPPQFSQAVEEGGDVAARVLAE